MDAGLCRVMGLRLGRTGEVWEGLGLSGAVWGSLGEAHCRQVSGECGSQLQIHNSGRALSDLESHPTTRF
jgi:hypothetical protein